MRDATEIAKMLKFAHKPDSLARPLREAFFCAQLRKLENGCIRVRREYAVMQSAGRFPHVHFRQVRDQVTWLHR